MIYTVTFNPSLDYVVALDKLQVGSINRTKDEDLFPGGKGINVSQILWQLGVPNKILGFKAGFTGEALEKMLAAKGCPSELIPVQQGFTRINVKVRGGRETAINGKGPAITEKDLHRLIMKLEQLTAEDVLVLSGSGPSGCSPTLYREIAMLMETLCVPCIDETIQRFIPGRQSALRDVVIDLAGAACGLLIASMVQHRRAAKRADVHVPAHMRTSHDE